ncbi:MAG: uroporphyrinogen-III C-methyltransferase [Proteobacteria bacterium]|nr:uroporphyrinogen-III C-methyltransferase [Pseudomonadota bacterium]
MKKQGKVYIIGAGPGDPGLITVRAVECLQKSDVVVYDYLVNQDILGLAGEDARLVYVGKKGGDHTVSQERLNQILVKEASDGNIVSRLKGGDPFIFGRGGEEAEVLSAAGIPFEIIPGVTSAISVPAYAGIPLTHRKFTSSVTFVTGHEDPTKDGSSIDWGNISAVGTMVFLMGVKNLTHIVTNLIKNGRDPDTAAALIRWGTTADQETLKGTLGNIAEMAEEKNFSPPAIFVVGDVVKLRDDLNWFERKPIFGKGVVITRPEEQSGELRALLNENGARAISFPTIRIVPPDSFDDLDKAIGNLNKYHWIIFTSVNGVKFFFKRLDDLQKDVRDLKGIRICAIGPATSAAVEKYGIRVDIIPDDYIAEAVLEKFREQETGGRNILLPRAEIARDVIPEGLSKLGANVDVVVAYRTVNSGRDKTELYELIDQGKVDVITFTSPSTAINFSDIMGEDMHFSENIKIACIGPVTAAAVEKLGLRVDIVSKTYTVSGLVEAIAVQIKN